MNSPWKYFFLNLIALSLGFAAVAVLLMGTEGMLWLRARKAAQEVLARAEDNQEDFFKWDSLLGGKCKAGYRGIHNLSIDGETIFSAHYEINEYSRRITPVTNEEERGTGALFFGCSFCFGFGVGQEETLPFFLGQKCSDLLPVNFATPGHGPQHMWVVIQQPDFLEQVCRKKGVVLYGFIDHHINRLMGDKDLVSTWGQRFPWLEIDENGVVLRGFMEDRESHNSRVLKIMKRSHLGRFVIERLRLMPARNYTIDEGLYTLVWLLKDIRTRLKILLPDYELVVFSFPGVLHCSHFGEILGEYDIPFFDYSRLYKDLGGDVGDYFFADSLGTPWGHPKATLYADVAERLAHDLGAYCQP